MPIPSASVLNCLSFLAVEWFYLEQDQHIPRISIPVNWPWKEENQQPIESLGNLPPGQYSSGTAEGLRIVNSALRNAMKNGCTFSASVLDGLCGSGLDAQVTAVSTANEAVVFFSAESNKTVTFTQDEGSSMFKRSSYF